MIAVYLSPVYVIFNIFIVYRLLKWAGLCHEIFQKRWMKVCISVVYAFFALSILTAFFLPGGEVKRYMKLISNYWLGTLLYITLVLLTVCIAALIAYLVRKKKMSDGTHRIVGALCVAAVLAGSVYGAVHARQIKINNYDITVAKDGGSVKDLKVILIADLHLGYNIGCRQMEKMRDMINEQNADIVLIAGDIFDNEYEAIQDPERMAEILKGIDSKYGTYAVYGNHDIQEKILAGFTFGGQTPKRSNPEMDQLVEDSGITLLRDEAVLIDDSFYVYGRLDYERPGWDFTGRKDPEEVMREVDRNRPVIILDHEPRELTELSEAGADVVLNGHTHDGQMFPGNITCRLMWENSCGYLRKNNMHNIVTSGIGLFGPYMKLGTDSEICVIDVHFSGSAQAVSEDA